MKAGIVDYRMGNLASVSKALAKAGFEAFTSDDPSALESAEVLVLPGVGNFAAGMANLSRLGLTGFIRDWAASGKRVLGICLGMQLLFQHSEEGDTEGLGILPGGVVRLPSGIKVPHMGWNAIASAPSSPVFGPADGRRFYFVHSYVCVPEDSVVTATTSYGTEFASGVESGKIVGVQFHPEKSSGPGLDLLGRIRQEL